MIWQAIEILISKGPWVYALPHLLFGLVFGVVGDWLLTKIFE